MPQKIGMLLTYSNKQIAPALALPTPTANANAYTIGSNVIGSNVIGSKLARFNHSTTTMQTIMRTPPGSCSSCGR